MRDRDERPETYSLRGIDAYFALWTFRLVRGRISGLYGIAVAL